VKEKELTMQLAVTISPDKGRIFLAAVFGDDDVERMRRHPAEVSFRVYRVIPGQQPDTWLQLDPVDGELRALAESIEAKTGSARREVAGRLTPTFDGAVQLGASAKGPGLFMIRTTASGLGVDESFVEWDGLKEYGVTIGKGNDTFSNVEPDDFGTLGD
jgi:hypothetical protein